MTPEEKRTILKTLEFVSEEQAAKAEYHICSLEFHPDSIQTVCQKCGRKIWFSDPYTGPIKVCYECALPAIASGAKNYITAKSAMKSLARIFTERNKN